MAESGTGGAPRYGFARVHGPSMEPLLRDGDRLWVDHRRARLGEIEPGNVVVARFADGTLVVKRAVEPRPTRTGDSGWWLLSDNPAQGVDSRHRGSVAAHDVVAVVVARVWPWPRSLPLRALRDVTGEGHSGNEV